MTSPNNCHSLFTGSDKPTFIGELNITKQKDNQLKAVREELKRAIRLGFEEAAAQLSASSQTNKYELPTPRFRTQGSYVYETINNPAYPPQQQLDLDLGIYLPFTALNDGYLPQQTAKTYFDLIESIVGAHINLHRHNQWRLETGKNTCVRVIVDSETHIDLPLYGVPAKDFERIKRLEESKALNRADTQFSDQEMKLDTRCIHMAMRDGSWIHSDPIVMRDWVINSCRMQGPNNSVRAVSRYLKAWRDHRWQDGAGPSSIFLLAHTIKHYDSTASGHHDHFKAVVEQLPYVFDSALLVPAPTPDDNDAHEDLNSRIDEKDKLMFRTAFDDLKQSYDAAMKHHIVETANQMLVQIFGGRFPYAPERIKRIPPPGGGGPGGTVRSTAATPVPAVFPESTTSG